MCFYYYTIVSRHHAVYTTVYICYICNIGKRKRGKEDIINVGKTFLLGLLLFISGCYGCNEHAHQFYRQKGKIVWTVKGCHRTALDFE
jgi:hypothetical protein